MEKLFFGCKISAPWPLKYPMAHLVDEESRHVPLAFLENTSCKDLEKFLQEFPSPSFRVAPVGWFDYCLFLPEVHPNTVAWHIQGVLDLEPFQIALVNGLKMPQTFLPHVNMGRGPFHLEEWKRDFVPLPCKVESIHLYKSQGHLKYDPIWTYSLISPFIELDHTADVAFLIQAESVEKIHFHAQIALAFKFPPVVNYIEDICLEGNLDAIIMALNALIARVDSYEGCPLKAVSFHGNLEEEKGIFKWRMIVDV